MGKKKGGISPLMIIILIVIAVVGVIAYLVYMAVKKATDAAAAAAKSAGDSVNGALAIPGNIVAGVTDAAAGAAKQAGTGVQALTVNCGPGTTKVQDSNGNVYCKDNNTSAIQVPSCEAGKQAMFTGDAGSNYQPYWHCETVAGANTTQSQQAVMGTLAGTTGTFYNTYTNTVQTGGTPGTIYNMDDHGVMIDWRLRWMRLHPGVLVCDIKVRDLFQCVWDVTGDGRVQWRSQVYTRSNWQSAPGLGDPATFGSGDQDFLIAQASKTQGNRLVPWF